MNTFDNFPFTIPYANVNVISIRNLSYSFKINNYSSNFIL